jgi:hypothetical protein
MKTSDLFEILLSDIKDLSGQKNLQIEYNSTYGGYRLITVNPENGGHSGAFGGNGCEPRLQKKYFEMKLRTIISTLESCKK